MSDENRIPLFVRVLPSVKSELEDAAHAARMSTARYVEEAILERIRRERVPLDPE